MQDFFNASMLIIAFLTVLVTILIGWQIVHYIFSKERMEKVATDSAEKASSLVKDDLKHISDAILPLINARVDAVISEVPRSIGWYFAALHEYSQIKDSTLYKEYTTDLLADMLHQVQVWQSEKKLLIQKDYLDSYVSLLSKFDNPSSKKIKELLLSADEAKEVEGKKYISTLSPL